MRPSGGPLNGSTTVDVVIYNLVKTTQSFTCPSNRTAGGTATLPIRSYSMPRNVSGMPLDKAKSPSKTVLLFEKGLLQVGQGSDSTGEWFGQTTAGAQVPMWKYPNNPEKWGTFHHGGNNFLFTDGHSQWYQETIFTTPNDNNPYGYWYPSDAVPSDVAGKFRFGYCGTT